MTAPGRGSRGLTLIELVVAMAIFTLVAVMGMQTLTGTLRQRDDLLSREAKTGDLSYALALLRSDLSSLVPLLFFPPEQAQPRSALEFDAGGRRLGLSVGGRIRLSGAGQGDGMGRAEYRLDGETLLRQSWPALNPAAISSLTPEVAVLDNVVSLGLRTYWPQSGWANGVRHPNSASSAVAREAPNADEDGGPVAIELYSATLPLAVELTLVTREHGTIRMVESLQ